MLGFRKKSFIVKIAKDSDLNGHIPTIDTDENNPYEGVEVAAAYAEVAKDFITHSALVIGGVFAACKIIERICR